MNKILKAILISVILSGLAYCGGEKKYGSISMRKVAYAMPADVFRVTTKDGKIYNVRDIRINPKDNLITGKDLSTGELQNISMTHVVNIEKLVK